MSAVAYTVYSTKDTSRHAALHETGGTDQWVIEVKGQYGTTARAALTLDDLLMFRRMCSIVIRRERQRQKQSEASQ